MLFRFSVVLIAIGAIALSSQLQAAPIVNAEGAQVIGRICAVPEVSRDEQLAVQKQVEEWLSENAAMLALGGNIRIAWHVIYDGATGNIPQSRIDQQIAILNDAFAGLPGGANTGYTFSLASVDRTNNRRWFTMVQGSTEERQAKRALAIDVPHRLNVYSCHSPNAVQWGTFPWAYSEDDKMHGVVLFYGSIPSGIPDVAVHEVGHYLGLYHTFQGGCTPPGDQVSDTPDEASSPGWTCPEGRDTCPSAGVDPIHNYMDYTSDACMTEFTTGQDDRMDSIVSVYRPNLLNAPFSPDGPAVELPAKDRRDGFAPVAGVEFLGATPNPFHGTTKIRFAIPESKNVELKVYDLTGRAVSVLTRRSYAAGSHEVSWSGVDDAGRQLASGVYFLRIQAGAFSATQRILLVR